MTDLIGLTRELELEANYADHMTGMAQYWMRRAQEAEKMCAVLVHASGGEIRVWPRHLKNGPNLVLHRWIEIATMETVFRATKETHDGTE
jgi:hypothetical protein